jgi:hypothetical protein
MINIGNDGVTACKNLKGNEFWDTLRAQIYRVAVERTDAALSSDPAARVDLTAYARAIRDLWVAVESATLEVNYRQIEKPSRPIMTKAANV